MFEKLKCFFGGHEQFSLFSSEPVENKTKDGSIDKFKISVDICLKCSKVFASKSFVSTSPSVRRLLDSSKDIDLRSFVDKNNAVVVASDFNSRKNQSVNELASHLTSGYMNDVR